MHEVLVNRLGGLSLPRKSVVRLTDRPDMTLDVYHGRKTTIQQQLNQGTVPSSKNWINFLIEFMHQNQQPNFQNNFACLSTFQYIKTGSLCL